jgi:nucleoid DNA-binding protein
MARRGGHCRCGKRANPTERWRRALHQEFGCPNKSVQFAGSPRFFSKNSEYVGHKPGANTMMSKSELIEKITAEQEGLSKKDVKGVIESLATVGYRELKKSGSFLVPGFAKFVVIKKPATKERQGINPFTKEPTVFKAKPARKIVRARPVKAAKDAV